MPNAKYYSAECIAENVSQKYIAQFPYPLYTQQYLRQICANQLKSHNFTILHLNK